MAGDYVIKNPVKAGAEWPVERGQGAHRLGDGRLQLESGEHYLGCIVIEVTRTEPVRITRTTFAPDLGPVVLEMQVQDGAKFITTTRARLRAVTRPGERGRYDALTTATSASRGGRRRRPRADAQARAPAKRSSARMPAGRAW